MSNSSEHVKSWRIRTKERMVEAMGGKCVCCGYNQCNAALELHHLSRSDKKFSFGGVRGHPIAWKRIIVELRKCVMVCSNCHKEIEAGFRFIPKRCARFNESFVEYKLHR